MTRGLCVNGTGQALGGTRFESYGMKKRSTAAASRASCTVSEHGRTFEAMARGELSPMDTPTK